MILSMNLIEKEFQSTLPVGGGTSRQAPPGCTTTISIHPPRGGRDEEFAQFNAAAVRFQSTLPVGGGTQAGAARLYYDGGFQSTLPVGGGTTF